MSRTVAFKAIGCRTNQQEIAAIGQEFTRNGYRILKNVRNADIIVVNTCCVTADAEMKTRRILRAVMRDSPDAKIVVTGCFAQRDPGFFADIPVIYRVLGNNHKTDIVKLTADGGARVVHSPVPGKLSTARSLSCPAVYPDTGGRTRHAIKIQEGCDRACSYCIVPSVRGKSRSAPCADVLRACESACHAGYKEMVLTGTHIGQYRDKDGVTLEKLLTMILPRIDGPRLRLSSLDPRDLTAGISSLVVDEPSMCKHVHLSVQSLCPEILRSMGRGDTDIQVILERVEAIRKRRPDCAIGADFIAGFPGETGEMFEMTCTLTEKAGFTYGHVFRYSPRPETVAAMMRAQVAEKEKIARSDRLRALLASQCRTFIESQMGVPHRIIVERTDPPGGMTSNYLAARLPRTERAVSVNSWLDIQITEVIQADRRRCAAVANDWC